MTKTKPTIPTPSLADVCRCIHLATLALGTNAAVRAMHVGVELFGAKYADPDSYDRRQTIGWSDHNRVVDRSLKAAKRADLIRYDSATGWRLTVAGKLLAKDKAQP